MALFRCASGSSGGGATITVTYSSDFYGETVTCSHGTKTYSKVATSSGTLEFSVDEEGTWTISSMGFSDTADVVLNYPAELVSIPDGETVLPTDDIETWLACAGITDKAYTTLSQVLADSETFNALLGDSNACAYMKRSTTWAGKGEGQVPTMTSNTTPSGECIGTTPGNTGPLYYAFDGNDSTSVYQSEIEGRTIGYHFPEPVSIHTVKCKSSSGGTTIQIQASIDGATWVDIGDPQTRTGDDTFVLIGNNTEYSYWRVYFTGESAGANAYTSMIQFYANPEGITDSQYAMNLLGQYDTACDALLSDATWASAIANSTYWESVLQPLVPKMTSDTTPSGTASASAYEVGYEAWRAFNSSETKGWYCESSSKGYPVGSSIQYEFPSAVTVCMVKATLKYEAVANVSVKMKFNGSNDGSTWSNDLLSDFEVTITNPDSEYTGVFTTIGSYTTYRAEATQQLSTNRTHGLKLQFYGRTSSGVKIHGANGESAYILDGGSPVTITDPSTLDAGTYTVYSTVAKDPSNLSNDYSKTVRICPNTKEIVLRPDIALYWYGVNVMDMDGYQYAPSGVTASSYTPSATDNTIDRNVDFGAGGGATPANIYAVSDLIDVSSFDKIRLYVKTTTGIGFHQHNNIFNALQLCAVSALSNGYTINANTNIGNNTQTASTWELTDTIIETDISSVTSDKGIGIVSRASNHNVQCDFYALWLE